MANLIAFVTASVFQCYPIYGAWTFWDGSFRGHCNNIHLTSWLQAGFNIALGMFSQVYSVLVGVFITRHTLPPALHLRSLCFRCISVFRATADS